MISATHDHARVRFRTFTMPCCHHILFWLGARLPNHCPECGSPVLRALRLGAHTLRDDEDAYLLTEKTREKIKDDMK